MVGIMTNCCQILTSSLSNLWYFVPIEDEGTKIYVGNLNFDTTMEDLKATFAEYGEVKDCFMPSDYDGNPRGFAFIQMEEENALKAIEELHGTQLDGRTLNVNKSLPKGTKASPTRKYWTNWEIILM